MNEQGEFVSVSVLKGGTADPNSKYEVDGISGGTITSKGVDEMLKDCLSSYESFFNKIKEEHSQAETDTVATIVENPEIN